MNELLFSVFVDRPVTGQALWTGSTATDLKIRRKPCYPVIYTVWCSHCRVVHEFPTEDTYLV